MHLRRITLFFVILALSWGSHAKKKKRKRSKSQIAVVQVDGAAVYQYPNFDSPIVAYLNKGRKIRAAKKLTPGIGGLGSFYKVKIKKKTYGYVTDVDLFPGKTAKAQGGDAPTDSSIFTPEGGAGAGPFLGPGQTGEGGATDSPLYFRRFLGVTYNLVNYTQKVANKTLAEQVGFVGFKLSGPGALFFTQLPVHLNVKALLQPPTYYNSLSDGAEGFTIIADLLLVFPFLNKPRYMIYYGAGPSIVYDSYQVKVRTGTSDPIPLDSQSVRLGAAVAAGLGLKLWGPVAANAEVKYLYEENGYMIFSGGLHYSF